MDGVDRGQEKIQEQGDKVKKRKEKTLCVVLLGVQCSICNIWERMADTCYKTTRS